MERPPTPDFSMLLVQGREPHPQHRFDPPRRGLVTGRTYGGDVVTLELDVVARGRDQLCVRQTAPGWPEWNVWVPRDAVRPVD